VGIFEPKKRSVTAVLCRVILILVPLALTGCGMGLDEPHFQAPLFRILMIVGDTFLGWAFWSMLFFWLLFGGRLFKGYGYNWSVLLVALFSTLGFWIPLITAAVFLKPHGYLEYLFRFRYPLYSALFLAGQLVPFYLTFAMLFFFFNRPSIRFVRKCGLKGDVEKLVKFTRSTEYRIQQEAVHALADIPKGDPALVDRTYRFLKNLLLFRAELKQEAADAIVSLGSMATPLILSDLSADPDPLGCARLIKLLHRIDSLKTWEYINGFAASDLETAIRAGDWAGRLFPDRADEWAALLKDKKSSRSLFGRRALLVIGDDHSLTRIRQYDSKSPRLTNSVKTIREEYVNGDGTKVTIEKEILQLFYDGHGISLMAGRKLVF
jgi:hypothetical protein